MNRSVILPSQIAGKAGVGVNDTFESLTFSYTHDYLGYQDLASGFDDCPGTNTSTRNLGSFIAKST